MAEIRENLMQSLNQNWFYIFSGQADLLRLRIGFAFLRYAKSEKQTLLTEIIPVERLTVIIKIIHFLMRLKLKQSIEMPKQSVEICQLINLLIKQSSEHVTPVSLIHTGAEKTIRE